MTAVLPDPPPEFSRALLEALARSMQPMADMFAAFVGQIRQGFEDAVLVIPRASPGGPVADLKQALASLTGPGAYCVLPDGYRFHLVAPPRSPAALAAARRKPGPAVVLGVGGRRGRRRRRAEERRAFALREALLAADVAMWPYVCPGCHAVAERCAPGCPDAAIEAQREHDRETREMYGDEEPDDYRDDGASY